MYAIDRMAVVIQPTDVMLQWIKQSIDKEMTLTDLQSDCTTILIPPFDEPSEAITYINTIAGDIFENELASWDLNEEHWPEERDQANFWRWFHVEFHSLVFDATVIEDSVEESEDDSYSTTLQ